MSILSTILLLIKSNVAPAVFWIAHFETEKEPRERYIPHKKDREILMT